MLPKRIQSLAVWCMLGEEAVHHHTGSTMLMNEILETLVLILVSNTAWTDMALVSPGKNRPFGMLNGKRLENTFAQE